MTNIHRRRRNLRECRACYRPRLAGQAFTLFTCAGCGQEKQHPNTAIPKYCPACCDAKGICQRCGGRMN